MSMPTRFRFFDSAVSATLPVMTLTGGNVGIGKMNPGYALDVNGTINATGVLVNGSAISGGSQWSNGTGSISYSAGNVGIGTSAPTAILEASKSQAATSVIQVTNTNASAGNAAMTRMFTAGNNALDLAAVGSAATGGYAVINQEANLPLLFMTSNTERLRIEGSGNVGVRTSGSIYKLDVNGNTNITGNLNLTGSGTGNI